MLVCDNGGEYHLTKREDLDKFQGHELKYMFLFAQGSVLCCDSLFGFWGFSCSHSVVYDNINNETMVQGTWTWLVCS